MMKKTALFILIIYSLNTMAQEKKKNVLPFSTSVQANGFLFISGQIGTGIKPAQAVDDNFEAEVDQVMQNLKTALAEKDLIFSDLLNVNIYLTNLDNYATVNKVYTKYFHGTLPARTCVEVSRLPSNAQVEISGVAKLRTAAPLTNKEVVEHFMDEVRSGKKPGNAKLYMTDSVLAHQMNAEDEATVKRTPENYAEHIREFLKMYGNYSFVITELIAEGNKVYARWKQVGKHLAEIDGHPATGRCLTEIGSAVYRLENGKICEYWVQVDRLGFEKQLQSK